MCKKFLFGVHLHQPVDNLDKSVEEAVEKCYGPLFETFSRYPEFKFSMHCSGWLFEKLKKDYNDVFENINKCNIEFFSGGYYEPVLAIIPKEDRTLQINKLNAFLKENFNVDPKGLWLTERVWDDSIVPDMVKSGIEYLVVDDFHFKSIGLEPSGYYLTEESGKKVFVFPISKKLRYKIPFGDVNEALSAIKSEKIAVMFDDAEKFGLWPTTYEWVYKKKWLEHFIEKALNEVDLMHFGEYVKNFKEEGIVYLPNVSYEEMQEWCLDTDIRLKYKQNRGYLSTGGVFKNFFRKYKESNHIHKRMLGVSSFKCESLFKLQTNDVYWHGIFGGLYLPNLRDNAYRFLIECEKHTKNGFFKEDLDYDGYDEIKIKNEELIVVFNKNGEIIELDDIKNKFNFQNTLTRRKEAYHFEHASKNKKEVNTIHEMSADLKELKNELFFDRYYRYSFIDHLIENVTFENIKSDCFDDFIKKEYLASDLKFQNSQIEKNFFIKDSCISFEIKNKTGYDYALELNFHFADYSKLEINKNRIYDPYTKREIFFGFDYDKMFYFPVETVSRNEKGFSKTIQAMCFFFTFKSKDIKGKICLK